MNAYKAVIKSGPLLEVKYYNSFRRRELKNVMRSAKQSVSSVKQTERNKIRGEQNTQRLILCNFNEGDWFVRFSAPYENFTESEFEKIVGNFFKRIIYHAKKAGLKFKYIGYCECGKRGGNWHLHIIIEDCIKDIAIKCWKWSNGINLTPLYLDGGFKDLAKYIRKDVVGAKRLKTSRNLDRPEVNVSRAKKEYRKVERTNRIATPEGYYPIVDETQIIVNDFTGAVYNFVFMQLKSNKEMRRRQCIDVWRNDKNRKRHNCFESAD